MCDHVLIVVYLLAKSVLYLFLDDKVCVCQHCTKLHFWSNSLYETGYITR